MFRSVANGSGVNEMEVSFVVHHCITGVEVAVKGPKTEHKGSMDSEEFEHVRPREGVVFKMLFQRGVGDFLHHQYVLVGEFLPHFWKLEFGHGKVCFYRL